MNEEEEEAPLEGPRVRWNRLAREKHAARSKEQRAADANRRVAQRVARNDVETAVDANRRAVHRSTHNDAQIALENVACVNAWTLLHPNRQQETCNADHYAHQGQREQLSKERRQEIRNADCQARNAQGELDRTNHGGNQVIPLARREFDDSHCGLHHTLAEMTIMCGKCGALHFLEECVASSSRTNPQFTLCCAQGKVTLPPLAPPPEPLRRLLTSNETDAKDFRQRIRSYNNALAFTSVGADLDTNVTQPGNYTYHLRGELYHRMGSLFPQLGEALKFAQLYISDPHAKLDGRMSNFGSLNRDTMQSLQTMLHACNPYANIYQTTAKWLQGGALELSIRLVNDHRTNLQRYNAPTVDEVGALMVGGDVDEADARDIVVHSSNGYFQHVSPLHSAYAPLHYILLFPDGRNGWHDGIPLNGF
jgi:hypothetical protein